MKNKIVLIFLRILKKVLNYFNLKILIISVNDNDASLGINGNIEMAKFFNMHEYLKFRRNNLQK